MNLRIRFLLGYGYLVGLLLVTAVTTTLAFQQLSAGVDRILGHNFESVSVSTAMLESLERQDSVTLAALLGRVDASTELEVADRAFRQYLERANAAAESDREEEILAALEDAWTTYRLSRDTLLSEVHERPLMAYEGDTSVRFRATKSEVYALLETNYEAMVQADEDTRRAARRSALLLAFIVILALLSLGYLSRAMQTSFLDRLAEIKAAASAIATGDRHRRIPSERNDELGMLARQLNQALDRQQEAEEKMRGMLNQQRQLLLAILSRTGRGSVLLGLDGARIAACCSERVLEQLDDVIDWIREEGRARVMNMETLEEIERDFEFPGRPGLRLQLLIAEPARPVGWIAMSQPRRRRADALADVNEQEGDAATAQQGTSNPTPNPAKDGA